MRAPAFVVAVCSIFIIGCAGSGGSNPTPQPPPPPIINTAFGEINLKVVAVGGVSDFASSKYAEGFAASVPEHTAFKNVTKTVLTGPSVDLASIEKACLDGNRGKYTHTIFYIATHGGAEGVAINGQQVTWQQLNAVAEKTTGTFLFIVNCCESGTIGKWLAPNAAALTNCSDTQNVSSYWGPDGKPLGFDRYLWEAMSSRYANENGILNLSALRTKISDQIEVFHAQNPGYNLYPAASFGYWNFPVMAY